MSGCSVTAVVNNQPHGHGRCDINLIDNRINEGMVDFRGDLPTVIGYLHKPFRTTPNVDELIINKICSDQALAKRKINFELERFYCDAKGGFSSAKGRVEIQLSYTLGNDSIIRSYLASTVKIPKDTPLINVCSIAIEKVMYELNDTIKKDAKL